MVDVPGNGNHDANISGIDEAGDTVSAYADSQNLEHSFLRSSGGTITTIDPPNSISSAQSINDSGTVAGGFEGANGAHGYLRAPGAGTAAFTGTDLLGMNASGTIVGGISVGTVNGVVGTTHSLVLATDGTYTIFDPPQSGAHSSLAEAINDSGVVVGTYRDANLVRHGYLRQPDGTFVSSDDPEAAQLPL
jgi:uncharacterized membrane protein